VFDLRTVSKAIAGAIVTSLVALALKHDIVIDENTSNALIVLITTVIGFIGVWLAPKNKDTK